ncbi:MAG: zf-HC2 domain-containing protein [Pseudohongiellaceae bacterium]
MAISNESQCHFIQLQIDDFLDGELKSAQREAFTGHVQGCAVCTGALRFARTMHDALLDMPELDCEERALKPVYQLCEAAPEPERAPTTSAWQDLMAWLAAAPLSLRVATPLMLAAVLAVVVLFPISGITPESTEVVYTEQDAIQAREDLYRALEYLDQVAKRTENIVSSRYIVSPLQDSLYASFRTSDEDNSEPLQDDPI